MRSSTHATHTTHATHDTHQGGSAFFQDIVEALRAIHRLGNQSYIPFTFDFIRVKSYAGTQVNGCNFKLVLVLVVVIVIGRLSGMWWP